MTAFLSPIYPYVYQTNAYTSQTNANTCQPNAYVSQTTVFTSQTNACKPLPAQPIYIDTQPAISTNFNSHPTVNSNFNPHPSVNSNFHSQSTVSGCINAPCNNYSDVVALKKLEVIKDISQRIEQSFRLLELATVNCNINMQQISSKIDTQPTHTSHINGIVMNNTDVVALKKLDVLMGITESVKQASVSLLGLAINVMNFK